jgi:uncharacterized membrane protein
VASQHEAASAPFEAVLYPNQPLGRAGFIALMAAMSSVALGLGAAFVVVGAWPVSGFLGLDVLLVYLAFRHARRAGRRRELIRLDRDGLRVLRVEPDGASAEWRFEPHWVRVQMDDPPRRDSLLTLVSHGRRLVIGLFLTPEERLDLARSLERALRRYR